MKEIKINCTASDFVELDKLVIIQGNLKELKVENYEKLKGNILKFGICSPWHVWDHKGKNEVLDGTQRTRTMQKMREEGYKIPKLPVTYIKAKTKKEAKEIILSLVSQYGNLTSEGLYEFMSEAGISMGELQASFSFPEINFKKFNLNFFSELPEEKRSATEEEMANEDEFVLSKIEEAEKVVMQFSGGKDSSVSLDWLYPICNKLEKPLEALFVDTGVEFPDLLYFIVEFCEKRQVPLKVLHSKTNFLSKYCEKGVWPDSIYRDCMFDMINHSVDKYLEEDWDKTLIVRGGRNDQKTSVSKASIFQEVVRGGRTFKILNPFQSCQKEKYEELLAKVDKWPGYEKGFVRTACWCCPFQKHEQYEAIKANYPLMWNAMKKLVARLNYKKHAGDTTWVKLKKYWGVLGKGI